MSDSMDKKPGSVWSNYGYEGSRKEAKERGDLIDAGDASWDAGFKWPLAVTADVYNDCVAWTESDNDRIDESESEDRRLWNLVFAAAQSIRQIEKHTDRISFEVFCVNRRDDTFTEEHVALLIIGHPDDDGNPCLTIRYPIPEVN